MQPITYKILFVKTSKILVNMVRTNKRKYTRGQRQNTKTKAMNEGVKKTPQMC